MNKQVNSDYTNGRGKTTIAPEVLLTIAQLTSLETPGVARMANVPSAVNRLFRRSSSQGIHIDIREDTVNADLYVVLKNDVNIRDVSRQLQQKVARAISEMVGMRVGQINVHVEDIEYPAENE